MKEPNFREQPKLWVLWNMFTYENNEETAIKLLKQKMWLQRF
jgi:hypothetical protein